MIDYVIVLIACMSPMWDYVLTLYIALLVVATVPVIIREVVRIYV